MASNGVGIVRFSHFFSVRYQRAHCDFETVRGETMTRALLILIAVTYAVLMFINWPQLGDPLIRHDDYPAFFGDERSYYGKTLTEGRWLNYWWISREPMWPAPLAFLHYQLGWAIFCAAAGLTAFGAGHRLLFAGLTSVLIALSPQAYLISAWFNTLGLGIWVLAIFAVLTLYVSARNARWLMLVFAPISMLAYTTYPLVMSVLLFARHDTRRSIRDALLLLSLLAVSIVLGLILMYSINYHAHGVFGLQIADWRTPSPARDLESLIANARVLPQFFEGILTSMGFGIAWIGAMNIMLVAAGLAVLVHQSRLEALYLVLGLVAAVGVLLLNGLKEGVDIPMRAMIGAWVFFAVILARATYALSTGPNGKAVTVAAGVLAAFYAGHLQKNTRFFTEWLAETRDLAAQLPADAEEFVIFGHIWSLPGASEARISHFYALSARLTQHSGLPGVNCDDKDVRCPHAPPFDLDAADDEVLIQRVGDVVFLRMPAKKPGRWHPIEKKPPNRAAALDAQAERRTW